MGRVVIWRWTTPIGGEPELAFLPFPLLLFSFSFFSFSLSLVATEEGSGLFLKPVVPSTLWPRRSAIPWLDSTYPSSIILQKYSSNVHLFVTQLLPSQLLLALNQHAEQSFHPLSNRISLWIRQKHLTGTKPHVSTRFSAIPVLNPRKLEAFERQIFNKMLESTRDLSRLDSPLCDFQKKKKIKR